MRTALFMKSLSDILQGEPVWVNPDHRIDSAIFLMRGHRVSGLPVLDGTRLVGLLTANEMLGVGISRRVEEVMLREPITLADTMSVRDAAEIMTRQQSDILPVMNADGTLRGIVTASELLMQMRRPTDPLTDLPWADTMREWAVEMLEAGQEITILFFDVNDFGLFNKKHGHIVGDSVLKSVALLMQNVCDDSLDSLCRYGGDEFCIATLRHSASAQDLAKLIEQDCRQLRIPELQGEGISVTFGIRGGRRTREREQTHYAATLNSLINLASQDCMLAKTLRSEKKAPAAAPLEAEAVVQGAVFSASQSSASVTVTQATSENAESAAEPSADPGDLRLSALEVSQSAAITQVRVELQAGMRSPVSVGRDISSGMENAPPLTTYRTTLFRVVAPEGIDRLVAEATFSALRRALPDGYDLTLEDVILQDTADKRALVTVRGEFRTPTERRPLEGSLLMEDDTYRSVALASLAAAVGQVGEFLSSARS